jgi:hypothetical protein
MAELRPQQEYHVVKMFEYIRNQMSLMTDDEFASAIDSDSYHELDSYITDRFIMIINNRSDKS